MAETETNSLKKLPHEWPGAFGLYKYSKQAVQINLWTLVFIGLLNIGVSILLQILFKERFGNVVSYIIGGLSTAATTIVYLASIKGRQITVETAIKQALPFWLRMLVLNILITFALVGSFLLLIVPFFFVLPRVLLANYYLVDKNMDPLDAFKASWHATQGHNSKIWGIIGANVAMALLVVTVIGIPFAIYFLIMYSAAFALAYAFLPKHTA